MGSQAGRHQDIKLDERGRRVNGGVDASPCHSVILPTRCRHLSENVCRQKGCNACHTLCCVGELKIGTSELRGGRRREENSVQNVIPRHLR